MRIQLFTNIPTPYRVQLFEKWAARPDIDLQLVFLAETELTRSWRGLLDDVSFDFKILDSPWFWRGFAARKIKLNSGVWSSIRHFRPDVVITSGYDEIAYWQVALIRKITRKPRVNWNGITPPTARDRGSLVRWLKSVFVRSADASVTYGSLATQYLIDLGVDADSVVTGVNTTDIERVADAVRVFRASDKFQAERAKYPPFLISVVGRLLRFKGIDDILLALDEIDSGEIGLLVVGDGPDQERLLKLVKDHSMRNIYFLGFTENQLLIQQYALSDISIFASHRDVWGMVVNESLASGLYTLCSTGAGVHADLIQPGINGDVFWPGNAHGLAELIRSAFLRSDILRRERQRISDSVVKIANPERHIDAMMRSIEIGIEKSGT